MDLRRPPQQIDAELEAWRGKGDELADAVVVELIRSGAIKGHGGDLVAAVERQAQAGGRRCAELLEYSYTVPSWVRFPEMRAGTQLINALAGRRPTFLPASALRALSRRMLGDEFSDQLGLPPSRAWSTVTQVMPLLSRAQLQVEKVPFTRFPLEHLGEKVARLVYEHGFAPVR